MKTQRDGIEILADQINKSKPAHTATPWKTNGGKSIYSDSKQVALMRASNSGWLNNQPCASEEEANANASYIVTCVNAHEELVAACRLAVKQGLELGFNDGFLKACMKALSRAEVK